jgi:hypothetical protein
MGLPAGIASAVGLVVASSTFVLQGQGFGIGGPGFLIAMVLAMLVNLFAIVFIRCTFGNDAAGRITQPLHASRPGPVHGDRGSSRGLRHPHHLRSECRAAVPGIIVHDVFWDWMPARGFSVALALIFVITNLRGIR